MTTTILVLSALLAGGVLWLAVEVLRLRRRVDAVPADGGVFEALRLLDTDLGRVEGVVADMLPRFEEVERLFPEAIRYTGVVAFDAYGDVAGDLSRAIALLNGAGNGIVVTLLVGRNDTRWFTKQVRAGRGSERLSPEEELAVRRALSGTMPP